MSKREVSSPRRRYARSSTISVTQLLSDSCTNLLNRLTGRARGPSQVAESAAGMRSRLTAVDIGSDVVPASPHDYWQRLVDPDKKPKSSAADAGKLKRDRTGTSKSDVKNSSGITKNDSSLEQKYSKSEIGENLLRSKYGEDIVEKENSLPFRRTYKVYPAADGSKISGKNSAEEKFSKNCLLEDLSLNSLGATRMRLENKYSEALNKVVKRKRDLKKAPSPTELPKFGLAKSATTANILLSEKAYPFVSTAMVVPRDKTPFRLEKESASRSLRHKSCKDELQPAYRKSGPLRTDFRSTSQACKPYLKICSIDIDKEKGEDEEEEEKKKKKKTALAAATEDALKDGTVKKCKEACVLDEATSEREVKRKEIQSLINKYVMLDEAYNRLNAKAKKSRTKETTVKLSASTQTLVSSKVAIVSRRFAVWSEIT